MFYVAVFEVTCTIYDIFLFKICIRMAPCEVFHYPKNNSSIFKVKSRLVRLHIFRHLFEQGVIITAYYAKN